VFNRTICMMFNLKNLTTPIATLCGGKSVWTQVLFIYKAVISACITLSQQSNLTASSYVYGSNTVEIDMIKWWKDDDKWW